MHCPVHFAPDAGGQMEVGVQVDEGPQGLSLPSVQVVTGGGGVGVAMHCPPQLGPWGVGQTIVGVQVDDGRQGAS
jgi:hypothetical protein